MEAFEYIITLKNEKRKLYNQIGVFILLGLVLAFCFRRFADNNFQFTPKMIGLPIALIIFIALQFYFRNTKYKFGLEVFFIVIFSVFIGQNDYLLAGIALLFLILYQYSVNEKRIFISEEKIVYPSFPKKRFQWAELNNMLLKDGLLTIDFKNNKIIQQLADEEKNIPDEKEFNEFCRQQLAKCN